MESINRKKIGILLILCSLVIFMIVIVMPILPKGNEQKVEVNTELSNEKTMSLLKSVRKHLSSSENLESNVFSKDEMISFALAYMGIDEKYMQYILYDEESEVAVANLDKVIEVIEYIFDVKLLDYDEVNYEIKDGKIYLPFNMQGGDLQIYKYRQTDYNENEDVYIAYIDCLEFVGEISTEIFDPAYTTYDSNSVIATLVIKYKVVENRKVLLAYKFESNI